jgi:hypothetical protein
MQKANNVVVVNGKKFFVGIIPARTLLSLDARVVLCVAPILEMARNFNFETAARGIITPEQIIDLKNAVVQMLASDKGAEFTSVVLELIGYTTYIAEGQPSVEVRGNEDVIFRDGVMDMYELAFKVGRHCKLSPFALPAVLGLTLTAGSKVGETTSQGSLEP